MELDEYIKFANENPISFLATVDGTQPRVRGFQLWYADKSGLYYSSAAGKDIYKQLKANPKVEACNKKIRRQTVGNLETKIDRPGIHLTIDGTVFIDDFVLRQAAAEWCGSQNAWLGCRWLVGGN